MLISYEWKDYELFDCACGERLERWGDYRLVRPDPQVIWTKQNDPALWKSINARYHRSSEGGGEWEVFDLPESWDIRYRDRIFRVKPFSFKHTGLFPEQAVNWDWIEERIRSTDRKVRVLNLFAYTGGATLAALASGASVTHVDASKGMVTWAKENAAASGLSDRPVRWLVDDCLKFVQREIRRGKTYDAIIMDPPSYGRGPKGEIWKLTETIDAFLAECVKLLSDTPVFFLLNSYTTGLQPGVLQYLLEENLKGRSAVITSDEVGLPVSSNGRILPCGACGRAVFEGS